MKQILTDVYWIDTGMSNCYICRDDDGLTLIDTGTPRAAKTIFEAVAEAGFAAHDIVRILLTHADIDHAGGLSACQSESGASVFSSAATADLVAKGQSPQHLPRLLQVIGDTFFRYPAVSPAAITVIQEGDSLPVLGGLDVLATPGHTMDHLSFFSPSTGVLFAGDILSTRDDRVQLTPPRITADQDAANRSALRLIEMSPVIIACGHGTPLTDHASDDLMMLAREIRRHTGE